MGRGAESVNHRCCSLHCSALHTQRSTAEICSTGFTGPDLGNVNPCATMVQHFFFRHEKKGWSRDAQMGHSLLLRLVFFFLGLAAGLNFPTCSFSPTLWFHSTRTSPAWIHKASVICNGSRGMIDYTIEILRQRWDLPRSRFSRMMS